MADHKEETITFKVDRKLAKALAGISNRSAFIRDAIQMVLGGRCPVCGGTGVLSASQLEHWRQFETHHRVVACERCDELHLVCDHETNLQQ
jgi:hypothetical protein